MHRLRALQALVSRITGNDQTNERIRSILSRIEKEAGGLLTLMANPDPMKSAVAHELLVNAEKARLRALVAESQGKLTNLVSAYRAAHDATRVDKAKLVPDGFAAEIRSVFRPLDATKKHAFMAEAIKAGDASTIAAIVTAPSVLSGLPAEHCERYREAFLETISPSNKGIADEMQTVCDTAIRTVEPLGNPTTPFTAKA